MGGEWHEVAVEEIKAQSENALATGPFGSSIGSRFFADSGVPVIRGSNLSEDIGTRLNDQGLVFLSPDKAREFRPSTVRDGDLVFTCWGTVNQVGLIDWRAAHREYIISNKQMKLTPDPAKADSLFLYYLFSGPELQHRIKNQSIGSSVPGFNLGQLRAMRIRVPEVEEQRAIAHILGTLDDKIELNRRMNETLEAMAQALFKSWFVAFDPVRAKAEGRDPGLSQPLADLFPNRFEGSELGEIPRGWRVASLEQLFRDDEECVLTGPFGSNLHAHDYREDGVPLILVKHVVDGQILDDGLPRVGDHKLPDLERYRLRLGDIVFTRVGAVGRSAYVHARCVGWLISGQMLRVRVPDWSVLHPRYLAQLFLEKTFTDMVEGHALGTTRPSLNTGLLRAFRFIAPPGDLVQIFTKKVASFDALIQTNRDESRTLAALRDTLLPKLISGELRVKDAERFIGRAV